MGGSARAAGGYEAPRVRRQVAVQPRTAFPGSVEARGSRRGRWGHAEPGGAPRGDPIRRGRPLRMTWPARRRAGIIVFDAAILLLALLTLFILDTGGGRLRVGG